MAFQTAPNVPNQGHNDSWKAQGFLNLYLPGKNGGGRRKLGTIPLKEARPKDAQLLAWLQEDPSRVEKILAHLEIDFQAAGGSEDTGFDLPE